MRYRLYRVYQERVCLMELWRHEVRNSWRMLAYIDEDSGEWTIHHYPPTSFRQMHYYSDEYHGEFTAEQLIEKYPDLVFHLMEL